MSDVASTMSDDEEEQANELLVLQSVYGASLVVADSITEGDVILNAFSIEIEVQLPAPILVKAEASEGFDHSEHEHPLHLETAVSRDVMPQEALARDPRKIISAETKVVDAQPVMPTRSGSGGALATARFLPPMCLALVLPVDYPSKAPPRFTLSALWLDVEQLSACAAALDQLWSEMAGNSVCFAWVEWLKHEALTTLGLDGGSTSGFSNGDPTPVLTFWPHGMRPEQPAASVGGDTTVDDERVVCQCEDPGEALMEVLRYSFDEEQRAFAQELHACPICLDECPGSACVAGVGTGCDHVSCRHCLGAMIEAAVDANQPDVIACPLPSCRVKLPSALIVQLVPHATYAKWEQQAKAALLAALPGLVYCPRCDPASANFKGRLSSKSQLCKFWAAGSCAAGASCRFAHGDAELRPVPHPVPCLPIDDSDLCICPDCAFNFCAACHELYHPGSGCASFAARQAYLASRAAHETRHGQTGSSRAVSAQASLRAKLEELRTLEVIKKTTKQCPGCKAAIERTEGCNHMQCRMCQAHFCWQCQQLIEHANPYDHFRSGACVVFPADAAPRGRGAFPPLRLTAAQRREDRLARLQLGRQHGIPDVVALQRNLATHAKRCPFCGAHNHKDGNSNHIHCHHCRRGFCFLCRADLRRGIRGHFSPAHPQHTALEDERLADADAP